MVVWRQDPSDRPTRRLHSVAGSIGVIAEHKKLGISNSRVQTKFEPLCRSAKAEWTRQDSMIAGSRQRRPVQRIKIEEFDPGSERTLAAWLRHASRTIRCSNM